MPDFPCIFKTTVNFPLSVWPSTSLSDRISFPFIVCGKFRIYVGNSGTGEPMPHRPVFLGQDVGPQGCSAGFLRPPRLRLGAWVGRGACHPYYGDRSGRTTSVSIRPFAGTIHQYSDVQPSAQHLSGSVEMMPGRPRGACRITCA